MFFVLGPIALWVAVDHRGGVGDRLLPPLQPRLTMQTAARQQAGHGTLLVRIAWLVAISAFSNSTAFLRLGQVLALLELLDQPIEVGQGLRRLSGLGVALAEVEIHRIAAGELRVLLEQLLEPVDGAGVPPRTVVVVADVVLGLAQAVARLAQLRLAILDELVVGVALDEGR